MPKSVPLRLMAVTTDEPAMSRAGSVNALPIAMATLRKNWSLRPMKSRHAASSSALFAVRASAGASWRAKRLEQATFRWCISSPMVSPRAISGFNAMPPSSRSARPSAGPSTRSIQRRRSSTSASLPPKRITLPSPSFMAQ